jgi:hypothetical protein
MMIANRNIREMQVCSIQGSSQINEDVLVVNHKDQIYGVIDGATSVTPYRNGNGETGGFLAANLLASYLRDVPESRSLSSVILEANEALRRMMIDAGIDVSHKENLWCAVFSLFRIHKTGIEYVQTGDCMLFARYAEGTTRQITHCQVSHLDAISIKKREEARKLGLEKNEEIFRYVLPTIRNNRMKSNTLQGYSVMNGEPELSRFLESGFFNRACLTRLYALTDGLFYPKTDVESETDWNETITRIDSSGLQHYAEDLIKLEESDPSCTRYPRHKISDDKTGVVIDLFVD